MPTMMRKKQKPPWTVQCKYEHLIVYYNSIKLRAGEEANTQQILDQGSWKPVFFNTKWYYDFVFVIKNMIEKKESDGIVII